MSSINIDITDQQDALEIDREQLDRTIKHVLTAHKVISGSVSAAIVDNKTIRQLKNQYFGMDTVTDVISFDLSDEPDSDTNTIDCEVVVNAQMAIDQAEQRNGQPVGELNLYIIHGLLHQLGYDDQTEREALEMHKMEDQLLDELGFGKVFLKG